MRTSYLFGFSYWLAFAWRILALPASQTESQFKPDKLACPLDRRPLILNNLLFNSRKYFKSYALSYTIRAVAFNRQNGTRWLWTKIITTWSRTFWSCTRIEWLYHDQFADGRLCDLNLNSNLNKPKTTLCLHKKSREKSLESFTEQFEFVLLEEEDLQLWMISSS